MRIKKRKAMSLMQVVAKIVIPLLVGAAILTSLQSIKTSSLDPKVDEANNALDQLGPTKITIGEGVSSDEARNQMQAAIVYNMLSAAD